MEPDAANAIRCADRPGTYEAWYVTAADVARRRGYWIRYTTFNPGPASDGEAHSALWAFAFDREDPSRNWGAKTTFPLRALRAESRPFRIRLEGATLDRQGCAGEVHSERGSARWELRWESREPPFPFLRPRWQGLSTVANIGAHPALSISGTIEIDGVTHELDAVPGGQQHTWGTSHAIAWNWGFGSGLEFWLDGATSRIRSRFGRVLSGTAVGAEAGGARFLHNGPVQVLTHRGPVSPDNWSVDVPLGDRRLQARITPRREDLIGVTYADPRGGSRFCYHTEVADVELRIKRGDEVLAQATRAASAAFEYASESPLAGVPILL